MITESTETIKSFRTALSCLFPARKDAVFNLLDAITSQGHLVKSVVQLSKAPAFERQYSSITDAIADGLPHAIWDEIERLVHRSSLPDHTDQFNRFVLDCTPQPRQYAGKLPDRTITHRPNPTPGNKPITVGHQYSVVAELPGYEPKDRGQWLIPLSAERVTSQQKGNEMGMQQIVDVIKKLDLEDQLNISIGDSLYGTENCRVLASQKKNLVHIFRVNSKRNFFLEPKAECVDKHQRSRKKEYGGKIVLSDESTHPTPDNTEQIVWITKKNAQYTVQLSAWNDLLLRGSRSYRSSNHPINLLRVRVVDHHGQSVFKRPMWIGVFGGMRHRLTSADVYRNYVARYDIEHFFRFGKNRLLMAAYQTSDVEHEQLWWKLCLIAYHQLYLARKLVPIIPEPWERYLPEYKMTNVSHQSVATPSKTQRGFASVLEIIGSPAAKCVPRGKARGRMLGETPGIKPCCPIIFKSQNHGVKAKTEILSGSGQRTSFSIPQKIDELLSLVQSSLNKLQIPPRKFAEMLLDSS